MNLITALLLIIALIVFVPAAVLFLLAAARWAYGMAWSAIDEMEREHRRAMRQVDELLKGEL